ncbi:MAG: P-loop NTPase [Lachnospiraceae bacterium]|nr:P-loop NTPase [Lachnospiraceae bacterium]MDY5742139.1 P-loop NTPase [Lachnospiraceae bacterium]
MSEKNISNCSGCVGAGKCPSAGVSESCSPQKPKKLNREEFLVRPHEMSSIRKVIGVVSGKGGVGKSMVTSLLASAVQKRGFQAAILDADITGPSIPKAFGLTEKAVGTELGLFPSRSAGGVDIMSTNLLLERETDAVIWRGPVIANMVKQFWDQVIWADEDVMFVDMPPGTGDVALTVLQSLPVDGIIIVSSPQGLVEMIVEKAFRMAELMGVSVIGLVENFSYFTCPDNGKRYEIFGKSRLEQIAAAKGIAATARLEIDPARAAAVDAGRVEELSTTAVESIVDRILGL